VAEWLWAHRESNIILSGQTGTGKTTSVAILIRELVKMGNRVRYTNLAELCDGWRAARSDHEHPYATRTFLEGIEEGPDYLVVDECADKSVITESTQEFMFRLLEDVTNGSCHAKVLLLGNFYKGAVAEIFGDEAPAFRRLKEKFKCGRIDVVKKQIIQIFK
jgi:DNA replication protein DnaC